MITTLEDGPDVVEPEPFANADHPMRKVTRQVAFDGIWNQKRAGKIEALFDGLASDWGSTRATPARQAVVLDAIARGDGHNQISNQQSGALQNSGVHKDADQSQSVTPSPDSDWFGGRWLECGSGAGNNTLLLKDKVSALVALDLSKAMLQQASAEAAPRVQGDSSALPFPEACFDVILLVNMLLFPDELCRVLAPGGSLVWVNTLGDQTPIHLPVDDVVTALPGQWSGTTARAGSGFWLSITRD